MLQALLYLILGGIVYVAGFQIFIKKIRPTKAKNERLKFNDKRLLPYLLGCFGLMLPISVMISLFVLKKGVQVDYVLMNSLIATGVFYFGLNPDESYMDLPK